MDIVIHTCQRVRERRLLFLFPRRLFVPMSVKNRKRAGRK